jgi:hypothetical protein
MAKGPQESEQSRPSFLATHATLITTGMGFVGALIGGLITAWTTQQVESGKSLTLLHIHIEELKAKGNLALERQKFETSLILEAIKTPSRADAVRNLKFFVAAGFISDDKGRISALQDDQLPSIGMPSQESASRALQSTGLISVDGSATCNGVLVAASYVLTTDFCIKEIARRGGRDIKFEVAGRSYALQRIDHPAIKYLALLEITDGTASVFLDRTRIRNARQGERVYLAVKLPGQSVELRLCEVISVDASGGEIGHNCKTGGGSAGSVLIAVSDDALLGVHHSAFQDQDKGQAAGLITAMSQLAPFFRSSAAARLPQAK